VTDLQKALYAYWISRLGRARLRELTSGSEDAGKTVTERAWSIVNSSGEKELRELLIEGFGGYFHQTVYLRSVTSKVAAVNVQAVKSIAENVPAHSTILAQLTETDGALRALLMVTENMEFLSKSAGGAVGHDVQFPVLVSMDGTHVSVHALTMQSTIKTWGEIVGDSLRRMLSFVSSDAHYDQALNFLRDAGVSVGEYVDYSEFATNLMKRPDVDTYSGTLEVGTVGSTKHCTLRGKNKRPMRQSMKSKFAELVAADRIINAEVEFTEEYLGLKPSSKMTLYPSTGKIVFRSNLEGSNPHEFILAIPKK